jgi:hypothetical protein
MSDIGPKRWFKIQIKHNVKAVSNVPSNQRFIMDEALLLYIFALHGYNLEDEYIEHGV